MPSTRAATSGKPAPPPKTAKPRRPSQPRRARRSSWAAGGDAGRLALLKEYTRDSNAAGASSVQQNGMSNGRLKAPSAAAAPFKDESSFVTHSGRAGDSKRSWGPVGGSGTGGDGEVLGAGPSFAAEQFFTSDSSVGATPMGGNSSHNAQARVDHALKVFGESVVRMKRDRQRRHSLAADASTASRRTRKSLLAQDSTDGTTGNTVRHGDGQKPRQRPIHTLGVAWADETGPQHRLGSQPSSAVRSGSGVAPATLSFHGESHSYSAYDETGPALAPPSDPSAPRVDSGEMPVAVHAERGRRTSELSQDSAVEELRAAEAAILSSRSLQHRPPGEVSARGIGRPGGTAGGDGPGGGPTEQGQQDSSGEGDDIQAGRKAGGRRVHLFDIVQMAVEADKRRCTPAAAVCPCYLCASPQVRRILVMVQEHWLYVTLNVSLTIFCIVAQDLLLAFFPKTVDPAFEIVYITACALFLIDTTIASSLDRKIVGSFYWFLDVAAALSLLLDVEVVFDGLLALFGESDDASDSLSIVKTTVRAGTRVGRILRLLRVLRLIRVYSCVRSCKKLDLLGQISRGFWSCWHALGEACIGTFVAQVVVQGGGSREGEAGEEGGPSVPDARRASFQAVARRRRKRRSSAVLIHEGIVPARKPSCWTALARSCRSCCTSCISCCFCVEVKQDGQIRRRRRSSLFAGKQGEKRRRRRSSLHADISRGLSLQTESQRSEVIASTGGAIEVGAGGTQGPFFPGMAQDTSMMGSSFVGNGAAGSAGSDGEGGGGGLHWDLEGGSQGGADGAGQTWDGLQEGPDAASGDHEDAEMPRTRTGAAHASPQRLANLPTESFELGDIAAVPLGAIRSKAVSSVPFAQRDTGAQGSIGSDGKSLTDGSGSVVDMQKIRGGRADTRSQERTRSDATDDIVGGFVARESVNSKVRTRSTSGASETGDSNQGRQHSNGSGAAGQSSLAEVQALSPQSGRDGSIESSGKQFRHQRKVPMHSSYGGKEEDRSGQSRRTESGQIDSSPVRKDSAHSPQQFEGIITARNASMRSMALSSIAGSVTGDGREVSGSFHHQMQSAMPGTAARHHSETSRGPKPRIRTLVLDDGSEASVSMPGSGTAPQSPAPDRGGVQAPRRARLSDSVQQPLRASRAVSGGMQSSPRQRTRKRHSLAGQAVKFGASGMSKGSDAGSDAEQRQRQPGGRSARASDGDMVVVSKAALEEAFARQQATIRAQVAMEFASKRGFTGFPGGMATTRVRGQHGAGSIHSQLSNPMARSSRRPPPSQYQTREGRRSTSGSAKRDKWQLAKSALVKNAGDKSKKGTDIAAAFRMAIKAAKSGDGSRPVSKRHSDNAGTIPAKLLAASRVGRGGRSRRTPSGSRRIPSGFLVGSVSQRRNSSPSATDARLAVEAMKSRKRGAERNAGYGGAGDFSSKLTITNPVQPSQSPGFVSGQGKGYRRQSADAVPSDRGQGRRESTGRKDGGESGSASEDIVASMFKDIGNRRRSEGATKPANESVAVELGISQQSRGRSSNRARTNPPIWIQTGSRSQSTGKEGGSRMASSGADSQAAACGRGSAAPHASHSSVSSAQAEDQKLSLSPRQDSKPGAEASTSSPSGRAGRLRERPSAEPRSGDVSEPTGSSIGAVVHGVAPSKPNHSVGRQASPHSAIGLVGASQDAKDPSSAAAGRQSHLSHQLRMEDLGGSRLLGASLTDVDEHLQDSSGPRPRPSKASVSSMPAMMGSHRAQSGGDSGKRGSSLSHSSRASPQQHGISGHQKISRSLRQSDHAVRSVLLNQTIPMSRIATMSQGQVAALPGVMSPKFARSATSGFAAKVLTASRRSAAEELQQALMGSSEDADESGTQGDPSTSGSTHAQSDRQKHFSYSRTSIGGGTREQQRTDGGSGVLLPKSYDQGPRGQSFGKNHGAPATDDIDRGTRTASSALSPVKELHSPVEGESGRRIGQTVEGRAESTESQATAPARRPFQGLGGGQLGALQEEGDAERGESERSDTHGSDDVSGSGAQLDLGGGSGPAFGSGDYKDSESQERGEEVHDAGGYHAAVPVVDLSAGGYQAGASPQYMDFTSYAQVGVSEMSSPGERYDDDPYASFRTGYSSNRSMEANRALGDANSSDSSDSEEEEAAMKAMEQMGSSRVGQQINQRIRRKIIVFVLAIILLIPILTYETGNETERMLTSMRLIEAAGVAPSGASIEAQATYFGAESAQALLVQQFLQEHPNTLRLRIAGANFGAEDPQDPAVLVFDESGIDQLRASEMEFVSNGRGSEVRLDISEQTRIESIYAFALTQVIIILLGVQAGLLQQDVDTLLVHPLERISMYLRPIMQDAISNISSKKSSSPEKSNMLTGQSTSKAKGWRKMLGQDDGEEMSTKLLLAAIECMRRDLSATARRNFARKELMSNLKQADKTKRGIRKSMVMLKKAGQMDEEGGLRFVPVADEDDFLRSYRPGQASQGRLLRPATSIIPYSKLTRVQEADEARGEDGEEDDDSAEDTASGGKTGEGKDGGDEDGDDESSDDGSEELDLGIGAPEGDWVPPAGMGITGTQPKSKAAANGVTVAGSSAPHNPFSLDLDGDAEPSTAADRKSTGTDGIDLEAGVGGDKGKGKDEFGLMSLEAMKPPASLSRGASMRQRKRGRGKGEEGENEELTLGIMSTGRPDPAGRGTGGARMRNRSEEDDEREDADPFGASGGPLGGAMFNAGAGGGGLDYTRFAEDPLLAPIADGDGPPSGSQSREGGGQGWGSGSGRRLGTLSRSRSRGRRQRNSRRRLQRGSTRDIEDEERIRVDGDPDA